MNVQLTLEQLVEIIKSQQAELRVAKTIGVRNLLDHGVPASSADSIRLLFQKIARIGDSDNFLDTVIESMPLVDRASVIKLASPKSDKSLLRCYVTEPFNIVDKAYAQEFDRDEKLFEPIPETDAHSSGAEPLEIIETVTTFSISNPVPDRSLVRRVVVESMDITDKARGQEFTRTALLEAVTYPADRVVSEHYHLTDKPITYGLTIRPENSLKRVVVSDIMSMSETTTGELYLKD